MDLFKNVIIDCSLIELSDRNYVIIIGICLVFLIIIFIIGWVLLRMCIKRSKLLFFLDIKIFLFWFNYIYSKFILVERNLYENKFFVIYILYSSLVLKVLNVFI